VKQIPNILSASRIVMGLSLPFMPPEWHLGVILFAVLTEFLDGFLARLFNWTTALGEILDPISDKIFFLGLCFTWILQGQLTLFALLLLSTREIGIVLIVLSRFVSPRAQRRVRPIQARVLGKLTTVIQYFAFFAVLWHKPYVIPVAWLAAAVGAAACVHYILLLSRDSLTPINPAEVG
jgi:cardiolipin synthase (CMP-forming)